MMEDQATCRASLEALPRTIGDAHRRLYQIIEKLDVLEGFLLGEKPSEETQETQEAQEEPEVGVVDECFRKLAKMSSSIEKCHNQLGNITERLGVPESPECVDIPKRSY